MRLRTKLFSAAAAVLIASAAMTSPAQAAPETLAEARTQLESLGSQLTTLQNDLATAGDQLEDTNSQIAVVEQQIGEKTKELGEAQKTLAERTRSSYKLGPSKFLDTLLGSTSFEDLVSRVYYMDKISDADAAAINDVKTIKADLDNKNTELQATKNTQEKKVSDMEAQVDAFQEKVSEAQAVYNSLDAQEQAQLAAEAEANAQVNENGVTTNALANAVQTSVMANEGQITSGAVASGNATQSTNGGGNGGSSQNTQGNTSKPTQSNQGSNGGSGNSGASTNKPAQTTPTPTPSKPSTPAVPSVDTSSGDPVAIARQFVGKVPYVWGGTTPSGFDCSGLVNYCFSKCGISVGGRTTGAIESYLRSKGAWKTSMDQLNYGDIVFTSSGHVGIYAGGGMMIDAPKPGMTVSYRAVYAFYGGGNPR